MSTHDDESMTDGPDVELDEPADPEAPAHEDPDVETAAHLDHGDDEAVVDGADPAPPQPS